MTATRTAGRSSRTGGLAMTTRTRPRYAGSLAPRKALEP
ncbi:hypothetical protein J2X60_002933 [Curtobacterium sp. 320]|nr:hypothetical protein [Curtobacterium sp. 320]